MRARIAKNSPTRLKEAVQSLAQRMNYLHGEQTVAGLRLARPYLPTENQRCLGVVKRNI
jgi:hypothetical protein